MAKRELEHDQLPIPNGWFAVAFSTELKVGEVKPVEYFGEEMVLIRTRSGQAKVLDPFCPHLGAHLGYGGRVMGETVRCPFHAWQFDGTTGACTHIPYSDQIPPRARVRPWDTQEKNGLIWVWHHAEQKPPEWDFPALPEFGDADWSEPRTFEIELEAHVQDTHENNNDPVHFQYVHGMAETPPGEIHFDEDTPHYRIINVSEQQTPLGTFETTLARDSWGLGLTAVRTIGIPDAGLLMYSATTPIDGQRVHSRWQLTCTNNLVDVAGEEFMQGITKGVSDDLDIWKHKVHRARPVLCKDDTYLAQYRQWVRQFYCDPTHLED
jgi:nitrite reductase/ring-hydroxylating ferredoxin subunit